MSSDTFLYHKKHGAEKFSAEEAEEAIKHGWVDSPATILNCEPYNNKSSFKSRFIDENGFVFLPKYFTEQPINSTDTAIILRLLAEGSVSLSAFVVARGGKVSVDKDRNHAKQILDFVLSGMGKKVKKGQNNTWVLSEEE